jgi:hypothetical protein
MTQMERFSPVRLPAGFDVGPSSGADGLSNGEGAFADDVAGLLAKLGVANLELTVYQVDVHGLRSDEVRALSRDLAGPLSLYRHVGANRFLLLATSAGLGKGASLGPLRRLGQNVRQLLSDHPRPKVYLEVRDIKRWSSEVEDARYLLYELGARAPKRIEF